MDNKTQVEKQEELTYEDAFQKLRQFIMKSKIEEQQDQQQEKKED